MSNRQLKIGQTLRDIYYSPSQGFRSTENIFQHAKQEIPDLKRNTVVKTYTTYKSRKGVKTFLPTWVRDFGQLQIDLIDLKRNKNIDYRKNDDFGYIAVAIEILSRYAFAVPMKRKDGPTTKEALEKIFAEFKDHFEMWPKVVQFDDGNEFTNPQVSEFLKGDEKRVKQKCGFRNLCEKLQSWNA